MLVMQQELTDTEKNFLYGPNLFLFHLWKILVPSLLLFPRAFPLLAASSLCASGDSNPPLSNFCLPSARFCEKVVISSDL